MPVFFNVLGAGFVIAALFFGLLSQEIVREIVESKGHWPILAAEERFLHWSFSLPFGVMCLVLDLVWRLKRQKAEPHGVFWRPDTGGWVMLIPVWVLGLLAAAAGVVGLLGLNRP